MAEQIEVRIITPARVVYSRPVDCISLPGTNGMMEILPGHVALFSTIMPGELTVTCNGKKEVFACADGIVEVSNDVVTLLVSVLPLNPNWRRPKLASKSTSARRANTRRRTGFRPSQLPSSRRSETPINRINPTNPHQQTIHRNAAHS